MKVRIGRRLIDSENVTELPYVIAEAGVNHEGNLDVAKRMIALAAEAGADAIKFQVYKAERLASKYSPAYWDTDEEPTDSQYKLFKKYDKFWKREYEILFEYAQKFGIDFMATPFDYESADFLEPLVPAYKIASADITNLPFLKYVARKKKPIILSTGASTVSEIWRAIEAIEGEGNYQIILLHCILVYPTPYDKANLGMILDMRRKFPGYVIGYSDHTYPDRILDVLTTAWLLGAQVIEKHFTYDKSLKGNDHYHSMDAEDLKRLISHWRELRVIVGQMKKTFIPEEVPARMHARRSIVARRFIPKGKVITEEDIDIKRPGTGVPPFLLNEIVGSVATRDITEDEVIQFGDFRKKI